VSLKAFYVRRCTRIMLAMFSYIAVTAILASAGLVALTGMDHLKAASYLCNTAWVHCPNQYGHLWSIGVEEQFYLLWPLLLILTGALRSRFVIAAMLIGAICTVIPSLVVEGWINNGLATYSICAGVLFALSARFRALFEPLRKVPTAVLAVLLLIGISYTETRWTFTKPFLLLIMPPLIVATVLARDGRVAGARISEGLRQVGLVSYSLYLWHAIAVWVPEVSQAFTILSFLAIPFAWVSYRWIEQPFIRLGHRWSKAIISAGVSGKGALEHA
jgi:peptidoglycan/LPS O-acetylase OafA/YrhL